MEVDAEEREMDAPQISTLADEPPSQPTPRIPTLKFRVKPPAAPDASTTPSSTVSATPADGPEADDAEEDQLIEDDAEDGGEDDTITTPSAAPSAVGTPLSASPLKRKPSKPRAPRGKKRTAKDAELNVAPPGPLEPSPMMTTFALDAAVKRQPPTPGEAWDSSAGTPHESASAGPTRGRKRGGPRKSTGAPRVKKNISKASSSAATVTPSALPQLDDIDNISEAGYSGTAASSPPPEFGDLEPEQLLPSSSALAIPPLDNIDLSTVPVPVYALPSKPFSVLPPPKMGSGHAPILPLDRSGARVRRWRTVHREVRGIAGGRWFARAWVGEKESEFAVASATPAVTTPGGGATAAAAAAAAASARSAADAVAAQALGLLANPFTPKARKARQLAASANASASASAGPSRSGSQVPEAPHAARAPSKMRTSVVAPEVEVVTAPS